MIKKRKPIIITGVALMLCIVTAVAVVCRQTVRSNEVKSCIEMGNRYLTELDYEQAVVAFQSALDIDPKNTQANLGLAEAYEAQQMYVYAEAVYQNMLTNDGAQEEAYVRLADLYIQQGKLEEAKKLLEEAKSLWEALAKKDSVDLALLYKEAHPEAPGASHTAGAYRERIRLELLPAEDMHTIYYTLDGTEPNMDSKVYDEPIILRNGPTTVKAMAVNLTGYQSASVSYEYDIQIQDVVVTLEETAIDRLIRDKLGIPYNEPVHNDDIAQITQIYIVADRVLSGSDGRSVYLEKEQYSVDGNSYALYGRGMISSLNDLRQMPFLEKIVIEYQPQLDISALADCGGVRELSLVGDDLDSYDIEALRGLPQLKKLNLGWNDISDISALSGLTELTGLSLWGNSINSIQPAKDLKQLTYFDFSDNRVADISALSEMKKLQQLWMYHNQVADISSVAFLGELHVLMLRDNPVGNPEAVRSIYPHLSRLDVDLLNLGDGIIGDKTE